MIELLDEKYELIREDNCFNLDEIKDRITDYFLAFDYVCGDYAYGKLRLKGFYDSTNKNAKARNDIKYLEQYIKDYCAYGAKIFLLKKAK